MVDVAERSLAVSSSKFFPVRRWRWKEFGILFALTCAAFLILGYHPGLEDDNFYLAAIRKHLNPALYPQDSDFFRLEFQATIFDDLVAWSVRFTHISLEWILLFWQFASVLLTLWACLQIARLCFKESHARWSATALVAALLTIPVSGTGIALMDQYLHPRALAGGAILCAVAATMERRFRVAGVLLAAAASVHIIMASFGVSCCLFLGIPHRARRQRAMSAAAMALPLGWIFDPATEAWKKAAATRTFYFLANWEWYCWLGVLAPVLLLWIFHAIARRNGSAAMARLSKRLVWFSLFQCAAGLAIMLPPGLIRLRPFEPMRYLHLVYVFLFLLGGGLIGKYLLKKKPWRWAVFFVPLCFCMCFAQIEMYPSTAHLEWPGALPRNEWVKAFLWVDEHTPQRSYFAINPEYMALPGEDYHGFRGLAGRSVLADNLKDPGMVARVPRLAARWQAESEAQNGWRGFRAADFRRLKAEFGVDWVVLDNSAVTGLACPYRDGPLRVCRVD
jgi:hypothetical protein